MANITTVRSSPRRGLPAASRALIEELEVRQLLTAATFVHPGILNTQADFNRMATAVATSAQPWLADWNALKADGYAQLGASPRPLQTVVRASSGSNYAQMYIDIERAYDTALEWKVTGTQAYADQTVKFLNAWASTNTSVTGDSNADLAFGLYGFQWANIAEVMRSYTGWAAADQVQFQSYLLNVYLPGNQDFLTRHNGTDPTHYWANWDLCNVASEMAIGVYCDRHDLYTDAMNYVFSGLGNGAFDKAIYYIHAGNLGQGQEEGRDQGHSNLDYALLGEICQMAWNQGDDLFSYHNNEVLAGVEYLAKYNLGNHVPFVTYASSTGGQETTISGASLGQLRPIFELFYNHYVNVEGLSAPYTAQALAKTRPEGDNGNGDEYSWGTLTFALTPITTVQAPQDLVAYEKGTGSIQLNWWGGANDVSYSVYRATSSSGIYTVIATGITGATTYTDTHASGGTYYYKVTGVSGTTVTAASNVAQATGSTQLVAQLKFDDGTGTTAGDAVAGGATGTLNGGASWTTGNVGGAVSLDGTTGYVNLPSNLLANVSDFTISAWVYLNSNKAWSRVFDFGNGTGNWMYLTAQNSSGKVEFATSTAYGYNKQAVDGTAALPTGKWTQVAVTFSNRLATLYVNGVAVGSNANMDFPPYEIQQMTNDWIGRSQYSTDPYLNGKVDDFRIYRGAMPAGQMYTLATGRAAPTLPAAPVSLNASAIAGNTIDLNWSTVTGATSYTVLRSTTSGGPYTPVATLLTAVTYADTGLAAGTTYYYVVEAANLGGSGANSPQASAIALPPLPSAPTGLTCIAASPSSVLLNWTAGANDATYNVLRSTTSGGPYTTVASGLTTATYTDAGLTLGTTYYYVITSTNVAGTSANSTEASFAASPLVTASASIVHGNAVGLADAVTNLDGSTTGLTFAWSLSGTPAGLVVFLDNNSATARNTTAVFTRAGMYTFVATTTDATGVIATSSVTVTVVQTMTRISLTPASKAVAAGSTDAVSATALDQFGVAMATQPTFTWSVVSGGGSISSTGVYTCPSVGATAVVQAAAGAIFGKITIAISGNTGTPAVTISSTLQSVLQKSAVAPIALPLAATID